MESPGRLPKLDALTALRFFAAAMLVVFHVDMILFKATIAKGVALSQGVSFFFVLSGFILYYNYQRLDTQAATWRFWAARFARVWPGLAAVTAIVLAQLPFNHRATAGGAHLFAIALSELAMVQSWIPNPKYYLALNPPTWSVSTEFAFYLVFPFLLASWAKTWKWKLALTALLTLGNVVFASVLYGHPQTPQLMGLEQWLVYVNPATRLFEFALGMVTALAFIRVKCGHGSAMPLRAMSQVPAAGSAAGVPQGGMSQVPAGGSAWAVSAMQWGALAFSAATMVFCGQCELGLPFLATLWIRLSGGCFSYALLIFAMAFSEGQLAKLLSKPLMVWLGEISYSVYLLHVVILFYMQDQIVLNHLQFQTLPQMIFALTAFCVALVGGSALIYRFIEKPWRRSIMAIFDRLMESRYKLLPEMQIPSRRTTNTIK